MKNYNPLAWYWIINGSETEVFYSGAMAVIELPNADYSAWCAAGGHATNIDTLDNLLVVLFHAGALQIHITSTGTPALNGDYTITPEAQAKINAVATYVLINNAFPGGNSSMPWIDSAGTPHVFPNVLAFKHFATAVADFVAEAQIFSDSGGEIGSMPSRSITIA